VKRARAVACAGLCLALAACAGHRPRENAGASRPASRDASRLPADTARPQSERYAQNADDGPAAPPIDVSKIPEPVPKAEPRSRYGNKDSYSVLGRTYRVLPDSRGYVERGIASWYGNKFHGYTTSNFEKYDMYAYSAASKTLPLPCYVRVTNLETGRSAVVRVNDRGPFVSNRIIDLSYVAAIKVGVWPKGTAMVEVRGIDPAHAAAAEPPPRTASAAPAPQKTPKPALYLQVGAYGDAGMISRSTDGGGTWTTLAPMTGVTLGSGVFDVAPTPTGDYLYASASYGLAVSQDEGANWAVVVPKVAASSMAGLAALANNNIYGTTGTGILHYGN